MVSADSLVSGTPSSHDAASALHERDKVQALLQAAQSGDVLQLAAAAKHFSGQSISSVRDGQGRAALHFAAQAGRLEACKYLLEELKAEADSRADEGSSFVSPRSICAGFARCALRSR